MGGKDEEMKEGQKSFKCGVEVTEQNGEPMIGQRVLPCIFKLPL
jgi:hypothetical protein